MNFWQFLIQNRDEIAEQTAEHLGLTSISLAIAILLGVLMGVFLTRYRQIADKAIGVVGVVQTIPSIALLGFLLPVLGIGATPAIVALFLYALLPIIRNTYTGIDEVNPAITEAARGMGMRDRQILFQVELPLAIPVIFAGIRTAAVATVGVATLCALIAAGGLGEFIFRGIALNNTNMILAGAVPAAALAVLLDLFLGLLQENVVRFLKPIVISTTILILVSLAWLIISPLINPSFTAGFTSEFMERADGYPGLRQHYDLKLDTVELDPGLMYDAIKEDKVDAISGFSTDGRIKAYNLTVLEDDKNFFPPYYAAPLVRAETLQQYPELRDALGKLAGLISNEAMTELNYRVDNLNEPIAEVVKDFLQDSGLKTETERQGRPDLIVGSKNFTEQYILAEMIAMVIENYTNLDVESKTGLAGTKIAFDALVQAEIDLYPEYTGTALLAILKTDEATQQELIGDRDAVFEYVKRESQQRYNAEWLTPFGFSNSFALVMRAPMAENLNIQSISDLVEYLE
ncbi:MAG: glycine betaine ABC transporter substrate-binding protein [Cyanobacteriota bacterium]|nr:glycine betaine ABC transporter substrate-binding protein [Cyanobacteriota bacterium]